MGSTEAVEETKAADVSGPSRVRRDWADLSGFVFGDQFQTMDMGSTKAQYLHRMFRPLTAEDFSHPAPSHQSTMMSRIGNQQARVSHLVVPDSLEDVELEIDAEPPIGEEAEVTTSRLREAEVQVEAEQVDEPAVEDEAEVELDIEDVEEDVEAMHVDAPATDVRESSVDVEPSFNVEQLETMYEEQFDELSEQVRAEEAEANVGIESSVPKPRPLKKRKMHLRAAALPDASLTIIQVPSTTHSIQITSPTQPAKTPLPSIHTPTPTPLPSPPKTTAIIPANPIPSPILSPSPPPPPPFNPIFTPATVTTSTIPPGSMASLRMPAFQFRAGTSSARPSRKMLRLFVQRLRCCGNV